MNKEQEYFARFGVILATIIMTYVVSMFERSMILDEVREIKQIVKKIEL